MVRAGVISAILAACLSLASFAVLSIARIARLNAGQKTINKPALSLSFVRGVFKWLK